MNVAPLYRAAAATFLLVASPLAAQLSVHGVVRHDSKRPLQGASAELRPVLTQYEQDLLRLEGREVTPVSVTTTDDSGRFTLTVGRPGLFTVRVASSGFVPLTFGPLPLVEETELPAAVLPADAGVTGEGSGEKPGLGGWKTAPRAAQTADGSLALPPIDTAAFSSRRLRVVDARGQGMEGVLVGLGEPAWPVGLTGADGRLTFHFRGTGAVRVRLLSRDGRQAAADLGDSRIEEETLVLDDGFAVAGRVVTEVGSRPLPGALVWSGADPGAFLITDAEGRYRTQMMTGGTAWLQAQAPGHLPRRIVPSEAQVHAGRIPTFTLTREGTVTGRVVDAAGSAVSGAWVNAVPIVRDQALARARGRQPLLGGATSAADGTFRLGRLKPGELYSLQATLPGFLPSTAEALVPSARVVLTLLPARAAFGRVEDANRRPLAGAVLHLTETGGTASGTPDVISDSRGRFSVAEIPAMAFDVEVSKPSYAPAFVRNFKVRPGAGPIDLGTITLRPGATIAGIVSDPRNRPIAGARVFRVETPQLPFEIAGRLRGETPDCTTGADGRFSLSDLPSGTPVHLLVTAPGYLPVTARSVRPPTAEPLRIQLEAGSTFAGRVLDPEGLPVSGAGVELHWQARASGRPDLRTGPPVSKFTKAGRDGRFEFGELPAGEATLGIFAAGFVAAEEVPVKLPQAPGEESTFVLERGAALEGVVSTTAGDPVAGARVLAGSAAGLSDSEGIFYLDAVPAGAVLVEVRHPHYERFHRTVNMERGVNHLDVVFKAGQEVRGRVVDPAGALVAGAAVMLEAESRSYGARTDMEGAFVLTPVAAGRYRLRASAEGFADAELPQAVAVEREAVQGIEVVLAPGGAITGRILGLPTDELSRVVVRARYESGESKNAEVDAEGNYALRHLRAGDWLVQASLDGGQRQVQARIPLSAGGEEMHDLKFGGHLTLTGFVLYRDRPLAEASVLLRGEHLAVERSVTTDHEGSFRFDELDADSYLLSLTHPRELLTHNQSIELAADRAVTIRLERSLVSGTVLDAASSAPLKDARVDLRHIAGSDGPEFLLGSSSDAKGTFRLDRVPPGHYRMTVTHEGYAPVERPLEVAAGVDLANLEVSLQSAPGAEILVRLASGRIPALLHLRLQSPGGASILAESRPVGRDGTVRLSTAPPGSWVLLAASSGGALAAVPLAVPGERVTLTLPDAARLAVRVPALAGSDSLADLSVAAAGGQPLQILGPGGSFTQRWQLIGGKAMIEGVPAGSWVVSAMAPDGRSWTAAVATDGRSDVHVDLQ